MRHIRVEKLSILKQEVSMRQAKLVPGKHGISARMIVQKEAETKEESIPVHMHQGHTGKQQLKYNNETPTLMVHAGQNKKTRTLPLLTEE